MKGRRERPGGGRAERGPGPRGKSGAPPRPERREPQPRDSARHEPQPRDSAQRENQRREPPQRDSAPRDSERREGERREGERRDRRPAGARPPSRRAEEAAGAARNAWVYGRHPVAALLANPARRVRRVVALAEAEPWLAERMAGARARRSTDGLRPETLDRETLDDLLPPGAVHQGVAVRADPLAELGIDDVAEAPGPGIILFLDQVSDPHNVGAVLRSAAVFGARAVVVPEHGSPPLTGVLAKAASGALEHVPLVRVT